jgi:hypothetical protein
MPGRGEKPALNSTNPANGAIFDDMWRISVTGVAAKVNRLDGDKKCGIIWNYHGNQRLAWEERKNVEGKSMRETQGC